MTSTQVHPSGPATRVESGPFPTSRIPDARATGTPPGGVRPTARFGQGPGGRPPFPPPGGGDAVTELVAEPPQPSRSRRIGKKGWLTMAGLAVSVFAIGLLASFGVETAAGHPLSGGSSGTSVGSLFGQNTGSATPTTSEAPSTTDTTSPDGSERSTRSTSPEGNQTTTSRSRSSQQQDQQNQQDGSGSGSSQRQLVPSNLVPQLGGGSDPNG